MNLSLLPDIFSLLVFIVGFRPLVRRVGMHANLWFIGWGFVLLHHIALFFSPPAQFRNPVVELLAYWSYDLCGIVFILASANFPKRRIGRKMTVELALPVLLQTALFVFHIRQPAFNFVACALFLAPAAHLLVSHRRRDHAVVSVAIAFGCFGLIALPAVMQFPRLVAEGAFSLLFLLAAYLYLISAVRYTRGVVSAVAGLTLWGLSRPLMAVLERFFPAVHLHQALAELPQYLVVIGIILTLLEEHIDRAERMAMHDPLTDLPNRRMFEERLIATMDEARENRTTVACLVIDVDNFKTINDTLGHSAGDQLLRALAVRLSWHMSPRDILARTGGDEFTALLAGVTDEHHLRFIASAMMSASSVPVAIDGQSVDVRISIGIALSPDHADDIDSLRRAADEAMYSAKRRGGSLLAFAGEE